MVAPTPNGTWELRPLDPPAARTVSLGRTKVRRTGSCCLFSATRRDLLPFQSTTLAPPGISSHSAAGPSRSSSQGRLTVTPIPETSTEVNLPCVQNPTAQGPDQSSSSCEEAQGVVRPCKTNDFTVHNLAFVMCVSV